MRILARQGIEWPGGEGNAYIARTHAGWAQKSAGAWTWFLQPVMRIEGAHFPEVAGFTPASEVRSNWVAEVERGVWIIDAPNP